jgi:hypothetical protein
VRGDRNKGPSIQFQCTRLSAVFWTWLLHDRIVVSGVDVAVVLEHRKYCRKAVYRGI